MNFSFLRRALLSIAMLIALPFSSLSQDSLMIHVNIYDADTEEPIPGISMYDCTSKSYGAVSNANGHLMFKMPKSAIPDSLCFGTLQGYQKHPKIYVEENNLSHDIFLEPFRSEDIVVTDDALTRITNTEAVTNTQTITRKGLTKAACCNLSESFETNPAVDVNFQDAVTGAKRISLLGLDGKYSQIMTEKTPNVRGLAIPYGMNFIPGTWMQSIQISKGTSTVATGYESLTGQINVEYKKPEALDPLFVNAYVNQVGRSELNLDYSTQLSDKWYGMGFFHGSISPVEVDRNEDGFLDIPLKRDIAGMARFKYEGEKIVGQFGFKAVNNKTLGGQTGYHTDIFGGLGDANRTNSYGVGIGIERYEGWAKSGTIFDFDTDVSIGLILSAYSHDQNSVIGNNLYRGREDFINANIIFETGEYEGGHKFSAGPSLILNSTEESFGFLEYYRHEVVPGFFGEYTYTGIENLTTVFGLRIDDHNLYGTYLTPRFHAKYVLGLTSNIKATAGRGWRLPFYLAETQGMLVSGREVVWAGEMLPEDAWNYGVSYSWIGTIGDMDADFNIDFYRTEFSRQFVIDRDTDPEKIIYSMKEDAGYSNSFQANFGIEPWKRTNLLFGYRFNDVQAEMGGELRQMPLMSRHMGFFNLEYSTNLDIWTYDLTVVYNGPGRYPSNELADKNRTEYPGWVRLNAQVTYDWEGFEIYLGGENLLDYRQDDPIIAASNPFSQQFDASQVWAPVYGAMAYLGFRYAFY